MSTPDACTTKGHMAEALSADAPFSDALAADALRRLPALAAVLECAGDRTVAEHVRALVTTHSQPPPPLQPRQDLLEILRVQAETVAPGLGLPLAQAVAQRPVVLTANHHGLDTLSQSWQSTLAFALPDLLNAPGVLDLPHGSPAPSRPGPLPGPVPIPVLATGLPSMNNVTFPAGLLCTDCSPHAEEWRTMRQPLSPVRLRQSMTLAAPAATAEDLRRARRALAEDLRLLPDQRRTMLELVDAFARDLAGQRFVDQASRWNAGLWGRLFAEDLAPPLAFLELEAVTRSLLERDLTQPASLLHALFWDDGLRARLLDALEDCPGCWNRRRLEALAGLDKPGHGDVAGAGTCFFWGVDRKGRQTPLRLERSGGIWQLEGRCRSGERLAWPWMASAILDALAAGTLQPSLFTSYAALALARGVACVGGVYQTAYLARMAAGTAQALAAHGEADLAQRLAAIRGDWFLAGVHLLFVQHGGRFAPAHLPDVLATGPLTMGELQTLGALPLGQAIMAGLVQTYGEVAPHATRPAGWRDAMSARAATAWAKGMLVRKI